MSAKKPVADKPKAKKPAPRKAAVTPATKKQEAQPDSGDHQKSAYEQLPPDHQRFVDEYILDFNATKAYLRVPGVACTNESARRIASKSLTNIDIQKAVKERLDAAGDRNRLEISKDRILQEVARLAFVDIRKLYNDDSSMKAPHELDDDTAAALSGLEVLEEFGGSGDDRVLIGHTKKVRLYDKKGNLELLMRHLGMLNDKVLHGVIPEDPLSDFLKTIQGSALMPVAKPKEGLDDAE